MAEPARNLHPEIEPDIRPDLPGGKSTPEGDDLRSTETANNLKNQEKRFGVIQGGGETTEGRGNLSLVDGARQKEEAGNSWKTNVSQGEKKEPVTAKDWIKKKGPLGALIGLLVGGGGFLGFFGSTLLPITIAEHFTNDANDMNASSQRKLVDLFGGKLGGLQNKISICNKAISFRCKLKSISPELARSFEDEGFKFNEKTEVKGKILFSSMEFPSENANKAGTVVRSVQELKTALKDLDNYGRFTNVISLKNTMFLRGGWFKGVLTALHVNRAKKIEGKSKEEADKSYEESVKGEKGVPPTTEAVADKAGDNATEEQKKQAQANTDSGNETADTVNQAITKGQKLKSLALKVGNALLIPQLICLTYNMAGFIANSAKIKKAARFISFAMIFLTLAASIKAGTTTQPEADKGIGILAPSSYPSTITDPDTGEQVPNPNINKTAYDSEAYQVVAYGAHINLSGIAKTLFVAGGFLGALTGIVSWINRHIGKAAVKTTCKVANSSVAKVISFLAAPVFAIAVAGIVTILPVEQWGAALVNAAIDAAAGLDLTTDAIGPTAGNIIFIGAALIMGHSAMKFGLKAGPLSAIRKNMADNNAVIEQDIAYQKYEAKKTPLDPTNRYSFLGSLAFQVASFTPTIGDSIGSSIGRLFAVIPTALGNLSKNADAAYSMPVADYSDTRFNQCHDDAYDEFGAVGPGVSEPVKFDMFCPPRFVPFGSVDADTATAHQEGNGGIDENGVAVPGSYLEKYIKYCSDREDPLGSTSIPAEEQTDDPDWYTGRQCIKDTEENQMASEFIGYKAGEDTLDSPIGSSSTNTTEQQAFWDTYHKKGDSMGFADILNFQLSQLSSEGAAR